MDPLYSSILANSVGCSVLAFVIAYVPNSIRHVVQKGPTAVEKRLGEHVVGFTFIGASLGVWINLVAVGGVNASTSLFIILLHPMAALVFLRAYSISTTKYAVVHVINVLGFLMLAWAIYELARKMGV